MSGYFKDLSITHVFKHIVLLIYDGLEKKTVVMKKSIQKVGMRVTLQCNDYTLHEGSIPSDKMLRFVVRTTSYLTSPFRKKINILKSVLP